MSKGYSAGGAATGNDAAVSIIGRFQNSIFFDQTFKEGMALVERTASYLDGPGRKEAKALTGGVGVLYATESMRLTTRLLDLASWLLIQRALREGDITNEEAAKKRRNVKLQAFGRPSHVRGYAELPEGLKSLIEESFAMHDRIVQFDRALNGVSEKAPRTTPAANPVAQQIGLLEQAFATKHN